MNATIRTLITGLLVLVGHSAVRAETLDDAMKRLAGQVIREMDRADAESVFVGRPDGPPGDAATIRMQRSLVEALVAKGATVNGEAAYKLSMSYFRTRNTARYSMDVKLRDQDGRSIAAFPANFEFVLTDPQDQVVPVQVRTN